MALGISPAPTFKTEVDHSIAVEAMASSTPCIAILAHRDVVTTSRAAGISMSIFIGFTFLSFFKIVKAIWMPTKVNRSRAT